MLFIIYLIKELNKRPYILRATPNYLKVLAIPILTPFPIVVLNEEHNRKGFTNYISNVTKDVVRFSKDMGN